MKSVQFVAAQCLTQVSFGIARIVQTAVLVWVVINMMYIEGHWETVNSLQDISRIIREYYNRELADKMDSFIEIQEYEIEELKADLSWWYENGVVIDND